jgi:hypothetical protein
MSELITFQPGSPLSLLFVAINHYISTGDHFGEGIALGDGKGKGEPKPDEKFTIVIVVNRSLPVDIEDFQKFKSKLESLRNKFPIKLATHGTEQGFSQYSFALYYHQVPKLTQLLTESPGPLGWGSMKELIDTHFTG